MVDRGSSLIDSSGPSSFRTLDLGIALANSSEVIIVQMTESPYPTLIGRTSHDTVPRDNLKKSSLVKWLAALSRVQMRICRTSSGAILFLRRRRVDASDGWEPALKNERADRRRSCWTTQSVDLWRSARGDNGRVAMELGCDYGDLGSILSVSQSFFLIRARSSDSANQMSSTLFTRSPC